MAGQSSAGRSPRTLAASLSRAPSVTTMEPIIEIVAHLSRALSHAVTARAGFPCS